MLEPNFKCFGPKIFIILISKYSVRCQDTPDKHCNQALIPWMLKKSQFMNSLNYCHSMYMHSFPHFTDSDVVYNGDQCHSCDQYRVSTSLNTDRQTYLCCALHTYNWRYWYYREVKSHYGIDVIFPWKVDVSVTMSLYLVLHTEGSCDEYTRNIILTAHPAR